MPQKQPPAITAVCFAGAVALTSSVAGAGTAAPLPALHAAAAASTVNVRATIRAETLDIPNLRTDTAISSIRGTNLSEVSGRTRPVNYSRQNTFDRTCQSMQ